MIGVAGLAALGFAINGIVAPYKREIAGLQLEKRQLIEAAAEREKILAADAELAEAQEKNRAELQAEIERVSHGQDNRPDACRLKPSELQFIKRALTKAR
jgi:hypothetical protein